MFSLEFSSFSKSSINYKKKKKQDIPDNANATLHDVSKYLIGMVYKNMWKNLYEVQFSFTGIQ